MKVVIDRNRCEANGYCERSAPEVFKVNDEDELDVLQEFPSEELRAKVEEAVQRCPKAAITIEEV
ncbi:MAG: ferredoxin [Acidimicrobiia bacterium]|nr:ferredoxin [Acidimicrobiia bacterium]